MNISAKMVFVIGVILSSQGGQAIAQDMTFIEDWSYRQYVGAHQFIYGPSKNQINCQSNAPEGALFESNPVLQIVVHVVQKEKGNAGCLMIEEATATVSLGPDPTRIDIGCRLTAIWGVSDYAESKTGNVTLANAQLTILRGGLEVKNVVCEPIPFVRSQPFRDEFSIVRSDSVCLPPGEYEIEGELAATALIYDNNEDSEPNKDEAFFKADFPVGTINSHPGGLILSLWPHGSCLLESPN